MSRKTDARGQDPENKTPRRRPETHRPRPLGASGGPSRRAVVEALEERTLLASSINLGLPSGPYPIVSSTNSPAIFIAPSATVTDANSFSDGNTKDGSLTVSLAGGAADQVTLKTGPGADGSDVETDAATPENVTYQASGGNAIAVGTFDPTTLTFSFTNANDSAAVVQELLNRLQYSSTSTAPPTSAANDSVAVTVAATDSLGAVPALGNTIALVGPATLSKSLTASAFEGTTGNAISLAGAIAKGVNDANSPTIDGGTAANTALVTSVTSPDGANLSFTAGANRGQTTISSIQATETYAPGYTISYPIALGANTITVTVNQAPQIGNASPATLNENVGGSSGNAQTVTITGITPGQLGTSGTPDTLTTPTATPTANFASATVTNFNAQTGTATLSVVPTNGFFSSGGSQATLNLVETDSGGLTATKSFGFTVNEHLDQAPTVSAPASVPATPLLPNTSLDLSNQITIADDDSDGQDETLTLSVGQGTLTFAGLPSISKLLGNGSNLIQITDTVANLQADLDGTGTVPGRSTSLGDLTYTASSQPDVLSTSLDDLGHSGSVPNPDDPSNTGLIASAKTTINVKAQTTLAIQTATVTATPSGSNLFAREPLTVQIPILNSGSFAATGVVFNATFNLGPGGQGTPANTNILFVPGTLSVTNSSDADLGGTETTAGNKLKVAFSSALAPGDTATLTFEVEAQASGGTLTIADASVVADDAPATAPATLTTSPSPVTITDAGVISLPAPSTTNLSIGILGNTGVNYTDYPVTVARTVVGGNSASGPEVTVPIDLSGTAVPGTDYEIIVTNPDSTTTTYTTNSFDVTIPAGAADESFTIRVFKQALDLVPAPNPTVILTLQTPTGATGAVLDPDPNNDTVSFNLVHPILTVNTIDPHDKSVFDPADDIFTLRGIIDTLNNYFAIPNNLANFKGTVPVAFALGTNSTITLDSPLIIDAPVDLMGVPKATQTDSLIDLVASGSVPYGVELGADSSSSLLENLNITGFATAGILVASGSDAIVGGSITKDGQYGIDVQSGSTTSISNATISGNVDGIYVEPQASGVSIAGSMLTGNSSAGVSIDDSPGVTLSGSTISGNGSSATGVLASGPGATGLSISNDQITGPELYGIRLSNLGSASSGGPTISGNTITSNTLDGVFLDGTSYATLTGNAIQSNGTLNAGGSGVLVSGTSAGDVIGQDGASNTISGNADTGVLAVGSGVTGLEIAGNLIGLVNTASGQAALAGQDYGVHLSGVAVASSATGTTIADNTIAGNLLDGVYLDGTSYATLSANLIGTVQAGTALLPNGQGAPAGAEGAGVYVAGASANDSIGLAGAGNTISGNVGAGVLAYGPGVTSLVIRGNDIGTDITGQVGLGGQAFGVHLSHVGSSSVRVTVGGTAAGAGNVISANGRFGVFLDDTSDATIAGNKIGTTAAGTSALGNGTATAGAGVYVGPGSGSNTIGGTASAARNVISGDGHAGIEVDPAAAAGTTIWGNFIGTDSLGGQKIAGQKIAGQQYGVLLQALPTSTGAIPTSTGLTVGGAAAGEGNLISGNSGYGVFIDNFSSVQVEGNEIGTNAAGTGSVANGTGGGAGVWVGGASANVIVGGASAGAGNTISGNSDTGVLAIGSGVTGLLIQGNDIGLAANGTTAPGGQLYGVHLTDVTAGATIGGSAAGANNVISGNSSDGVLLTGSSGVSVLGNQIGIGSGASSLTSVPNGNAGVVINSIGGYSTNDSVVGNTISGNAGPGVRVYGDNASPVPRTRGISIQYNYIGTTPGFPTTLGNLNNGVQVEYATDVSIGSNVIADNQGDGIFADNLHGTGTFDGTLLGSSIVSNTISGNLGTGGIVAFTLQDTSIANNTVGASAGIPKGDRGEGISLTGFTADNPTTYALANNHVLGNGGDGIALAGTIAGLTVSSNFVGSDATGNDGNNGNGVLIAANAGPAGGTSVTLVGNTVEYSGLDGVKLDGARGVKFGLASGPANTIDANHNDGLDLVDGATGDASVGNTFSHNGNFGIALAGVSGDSVTGAVALKNATDGLRINGGSSGNTVAGGMFDDNDGNGITIGQDDADSARKNTIAGAVAIQNQNDGILIQGAGVASNTLTGTTSGSSAQALISGNTNNGISILTAGPGNSVSSYQIQANRNFGLQVDKTTGTTAAGNTISGNLSNGVVISNSTSTAPNTILTGNTIRSNQQVGVLVLNSSGNSVGAPGRAPNTIASNNAAGVEIFGSFSPQQPANNTVEDDYIGTDAASDPLGNQGDGVLIVGSDGNTVSGSRISANLLSGIEVDSGSNSNVIRGNSIGALTAAGGGSLLDNQLEGILISGSNNSTSPTSTQQAGPKPLSNQLSGNIILGNRGDGVAIDLADLTNLSGNTIGGSTATGNGLDGVSVAYSDGTSIGSNVVLGNSVDGIAAFSAMSYTPTTASAPVVPTSIADNTVSGNLVDGITLDSTIDGTVAGNTVQGNESDGIRLLDNSDRDAIGQTGLGNDIWGNFGAGVEISTGSNTDTVAGNQIGYVSYGVIAPNTIGVYLNQVDNNRIVGDNTITGNRAYGIEIAENTPGAANPAGNVVMNNMIGTAPNTESPGAFPTASTDDVGVYVLNSEHDAIVANVASGNHSAGIELFGPQSTNDVVTGNIVGSDLSMTTPILTQPSPGVSTTNTYDYGANPGTSIRQDYGVWLNNAPGNTVGAVPGFAANTILGNMAGIEISGANSNDEEINGNVIGAASTGPAATSYNAGGLANFSGIYVANTPASGTTGTTTIVSNVIDHNISAGININGPAADDYEVVHDQISFNGGFVLAPPAGPDGSETLTSPNAAQVVYGSGVYIQDGTGNTIGAREVVGDAGTTDNVPASAIPPLSDTIEGNTLAGVYIYDLGTSMPAASASNSVGGDAIIADAGSAGTATDYGVILYNSAGQIPGVAQIGTGTISFQGTFTIAPFREYTGAPPQYPYTFNPYPTTSGTVSAQAIAPSKVAVKATAKATAASINGVSVTINADGKGHPLPPASKSSIRKG